MGHDVAVGAQRYQVWGRVPPTGVAAAVVVLEWGSTSASANVDYLASTRFAPAGASPAQPRPMTIG
jgi:hypothetical protein